MNDSERRMEIVLIRHGEPEYAPCDRRGFIGQDCGLAPLTSARSDVCEGSGAFRL